MHGRKPIASFFDDLNPTFRKYGPNQGDQLLMVLRFSGYYNDFFHRNPSAGYLTPCFNLKMQEVSPGLSNFHPKFIIRTPHQL